MVGFLYSLWPPGDIFFFNEYLCASDNINIPLSIASVCPQCQRVASCDTCTKHVQLVYLCAKFSNKNMFCVYKDGCLFSAFVDNSNSSIK